LNKNDEKTRANKQTNFELKNKMKVILKRAMQMNLKNESKQNVIDNNMQTIDKI